MDEYRIQKTQNQHQDWELSIGEEENNKGTFFSVLVEYAHDKLPFYKFDR